jgi:hypothetical protein
MAETPYCELPYFPYHLPDITSSLLGQCTHCQVIFRHTKWAHQWLISASRVCAPCPRRSPNLTSSLKVIHHVRRRPGYTQGRGTDKVPTRARTVSAVQSSPSPYPQRHLLTLSAISLSSATSADTETLNKHRPCLFRVPCTCAGHCYPPDPRWRSRWSPVVHLPPLAYHRARRTDTDAEVLWAQRSSETVAEKVLYSIFVSCVRTLTSSSPLACSYLFILMFLLFHVEYFYCWMVHIVFVECSICHGQPA